MRGLLRGWWARVRAAAGEWQGRRLIRRGRRLLLSGRLKAAEAVLRQALDLLPEPVLAWTFLAWAAAERGDWREAVACWRSVLQARLAPAQSAEALNALALALGALGEFAEAEALVKRLEASEAGRLMAPEARLLLAEQALDDQGQAGVRHAFRKRFPEAAVQSTAWLRLAGGEDPPEAARYAQADLEAAPDAQAARLILAYLELRLPHAEHLQLARQAVARHSDPALARGAKVASGAFQAAALMQMEHLWRLLNYLSSPGEVAEAQRRAAILARRLPENSRARFLLARAAVAANDRARVRKLLKAAGGGDLELWLAAADGDHARAGAIWERIRQSRYWSAADSRGLHLRLASREPPPGFLKGSDRILLFACFRNERAFAPWFLDYYRRQGVDWFFIVDNRSNDGTAEYLAKQQDATLFASRDSYAWAHAGMKWVNELMRRYGERHWCVHVDADEQLVVPGGKGEAGGPGSEDGASQAAAGALRRCVDAMAERGEEVLPAYMLDTYPADLAALQDFRPGDSPLSASPLMDPNVFLFGKPDCCFFRMRGGVRDRLFGFHATMEKAPVLRGGGGRFYLSAHNTSHAKISRQCGALLHHKLLREALDMMAPGSELAWRTDDRGAYCRIRHSRYRGAPFLERAQPIPRTPQTLAYESPAQLRRLGLTGPFNPFRPPHLTPGAA